MKNKKFFLCWLLSFGACNTVATQNVGLEDLQVLVTGAAATARAAIRVATARVVVGAAVPALHNCAKGVVGAANAIAGFADRVAAAAAEVARATDR